MRIIPTKAARFRRGLTQSARRYDTLLLMMFSVVFTVNSAFADRYGRDPRIAPRPEYQRPANYTQQQASPVAPSGSGNNLTQSNIVFPQETSSRNQYQQPAGPPQASFPANQSSRSSSRSSVIEQASFQQQSFQQQPFQQQLPQQQIQAAPFQSAPAQGGFQGPQSSRYGSFGGGYSSPTSGGFNGAVAQPAYGAPPQYGAGQFGGQYGAAQYSDASANYELSPVEGVIQQDCVGGDCISAGCGSGVMATYGWLRGSGGREYGVAEDWYSQLGIFAPLLSLGNNGYVFGQAQGMISEDDLYGGNVGLGFRQILSTTIIGASIWYDFEESRDRAFRQLGGSLELMTPDVDFRLNGYFPISNEERFVPVTPFFDRNNIVIGSTESVLTGLDAEVSVPLTQTVRTSAGVYHYESPGDDIDEINGIRGVAEWTPEPRINIGVLFGHDDFFDTTVLGFVTIYLSPTPPVDPAQCFENRASELVRRKTRLTIADRNTLARSPVTNQPIVVAQANANAADGGNGSLSAPFNTVSDAAAAAGPNGIIFVREGTFNESVALQDGQRLLGDGLADTNPHLVRTQIGNIELPDQRTSAEVTTPQIVANDMQGAIQLNQDGSLVNNVEIAGLSISNSGSPGIIGFANDGFSIHDNTIGPTNDFGILLLNASGSEFNNPTAPVSLAQIANNVIQNNNQMGVLVGNIDVTEIDFMNTGIDPTAFNVALDAQGPLDISVTNNMIQNNGITGSQTDLAVAIGTAIPDDNIPPRDDRFGVQFFNLTDQEITVDVDNNQFTNNGLDSASGTVESSGGVAFLVGNSSTINATVQNSTFSQNAGNDILAAIGDGLPATADATLNLSVDNNVLGNNRAASNGGSFASGVRILADQGTATADITDNVIIGDPALIGSVANLEAIYLRAQDSNATVNITNNEIRSWMVGVGTNVENTALATINILDSTIEAECILKYHVGRPGETGVTPTLNATVVDSTLIANLNPNDDFDAILLESLEEGVLNIAFNNNDVGFADPNLLANVDRNFINVLSSEQSQLNFEITDQTPITALNAFADFLAIETNDSSVVTGTITNSILGATSEDAINIVPFGNTRVTLTVDQSGFIGNDGDGIEVTSIQNATVSIIANSNDFQGLGGRALRMSALSDVVTNTPRLGVTLDQNNIISAAEQSSISSISTQGTSLVRVNLLSNQSNAAITVNQVEAPPGSATFELFDDGGNTPPATQMGSITTVGSMLDVLFP